MTFNAWIIAALIWFPLTAISVAYIAYDLLTRTPEMKVMKWGWILVALYTGPVAFVIYWLACREPAPGTHETFIAPLWKQAVGSTIHCVAGDATGIILAAVVTSRLRLPMGIDTAVEYAFGFAVGLLLFQALFMKSVLGVGYMEALKRTWLPEWLSMNAVMAGMVPVMIVFMTRDVTAMEPTSPRFWLVMSLATLVGALLAYPVNHWLVKNGLKHGMGTDRGVATDTETVNGHSMSAGAAAMNMPPADVTLARKTAVTAVTLTMLGAGVLVAAHFGSLTMRPHRPAVSVSAASPLVQTRPASSCVERTSALSARSTSARRVQ